MTDGRHRSRLTVGRPGLSPRLSLQDIVSVGLPAVYEDHGEHLVYRDGRIFDAAASNAPLAEPIIELDGAGSAVGLEFGWRHLAGCSCRFCRSDLATLADTFPGLRTGEASA